jgi:hypothetical protein
MAGRKQRIFLGTINVAIMKRFWPEYCRDALPWPRRRRSGESNEERTAKSLSEVALRAMATT